MQFDFPSSLVAINNLRKPFVNLEYKLTKLVLLSAYALGFKQSMGPGDIFLSSGLSKKSLIVTCLNFQLKKSANNMSSKLGQFMF